MQDQFGIVSKLPYLVKRFGLTADDIVARALSCLDMKQGRAAVSAEQSVTAGQ